MSRPAERYAQILDQIVRPFDLSHDFGRKRAYEATIDYARQNLIEDPHCNEFLNAAAKLLGFAPITFDTLESRVKVPKDAWLDIWISDEDDEVALTGTKDGIQYMIDLLTQLRDAADPEQHIHLDRGMLPMTENSANLVLFKEEETWFTGAATEGASDQYPQREIDPKQIYAIQFIHYPPEDLPISAHRLYRVLKVEEDDGYSPTVKEFGDGSEHRYFRFTFIADNDDRFTYSFHLDDPAVNYFTHREILKLAMRAV
ncbi:MAG: Imm32 family immunity protein [Thermoanaerobaculia bacterium]